MNKVYAKYDNLSPDARFVVFLFLVAPWYPLSFLLFGFKLFYFSGVCFVLGTFLLLTRRNYVLKYLQDK